MLPRVALAAVSLTTALVWIIWQLWMPGHANPEMLAVRDIHLIMQAQHSYHARHGVYARTLHELGISRQQSWLHQMRKGAYQLTMRATSNTFTVQANPSERPKPPRTRRSLYAGQTGIIRQNSTGQPATAASEPLR
jgi:Tfp pilus assembly protein PilE